jgi:hypothetical protein
MGKGGEGDSPVLRLYLRPSWFFCCFSKATRENYNVGQAGKGGKVGFVLGSRRLQTKAWSACNGEKVVLYLTYLPR